MNPSRKQLCSQQSSGVSSVWRGGSLKTRESVVDDTLHEFFIGSIAVLGGGGRGRGGERGKGKGERGKGKGERGERKGRGGE